MSDCVSIESEQNCAKPKYLNKNLSNIKDLVLSWVGFSDKSFCRSILRECHHGVTWPVQFKSKWHVMFGRRRRHNNFFYMWLKRKKIKIIPEGKQQGNTDLWQNVLLKCSPSSRSLVGRDLARIMADALYTIYLQIATVLTERIFFFFCKSKKIKK